MSELEDLKQRLARQEKELANSSESHHQERREMRKYFDKLNENLINLTGAVTEWKAKDSMYENRISNNEVEIKELKEKYHKLELTLTKISGETINNSNTIDKYQAFWLKIAGAITTLALVGALTYKFIGN